MKKEEKIKMKKEKGFSLKAIAIIIILISIASGVFKVINDSKPDYKNERVYTELKKYIPYYIETRNSLKVISDKNSNSEEIQPSLIIESRLKQLEINWGKDHLKLINNKLIITNKEKNSHIILQTEEEIEWVKEYFNL